MSGEKAAMPQLSGEMMDMVGNAGKNKFAAEIKAGLTKRITGGLKKKAKKRSFASEQAQ